MRQRQDDTIYRRPAPPQEADYAGQAYDEPVYDQRPMYDEPTYDEQPIYDEDVPEAEEEEPMPQVIATNRTVLLTCMLSAFCSPLALFLLFAEKRSRAIRHVSVQSLGISGVHLALGAVLLLIGSLLGVIPLVGFLMSAMCWVLYLAVVVVCVVFRVHLMLTAYQGLYYVLPVIGEKLEHLAR